MKSRFKIDFWLLIPVGILLAISLTTLFSINIVYFRNQVFSLVVALLAFFFFSQLNIESLKRFSLPIYLVSCVLLLIVLFTGIESRGAVRWLEFFGIRLQLSELLKPFLAISFATYITSQEYPSIKSFFSTILLALPIVIIITLQPDLGTGLLYLSVVLFVLLIIGMPLKWFALSAVPFVVAAPFIWTMLHDYQRQRVMTFLNPSSDPLGTSYNTIQAIIAVGSGAFWGKGFSQGTQSVLRFLPERQTDFIFATIAEGLGFIGSSIVIIALLFLCYRIYIILKNADDLFSRVLAICCFGFIFFQALVNIGMNMGVMPIVGVTLPFVSFGGSSLLSNFIFLGMLSALSTSHRHKHVLEIR